MPGDEESAMAQPFHQFHQRQGLFSLGRELAVRVVGRFVRAPETRKVGNPSNWRQSGANQQVIESIKPHAAAALKIAVLGNDPANSVIRVAALNGRP